MSNPHATPLDKQTAEAERPPAAVPLGEKAKLIATLIDLDGGVLVRVEGEARTFGLEQFQFVLARVIARRARLAVLDLALLTFLSSLAMGQLVRLRRDLDRWNGRVKIAGCPPLIREALEVARLADFFEFHGTVEEAFAAVFE
jgi:anti-anti-sigma factor